MNIPLIDKIINRISLALVMGLHHISWKSTSSGVEDEYIHAAALSWLVGSDEYVEIERLNSYHGSPVHSVTAEINKRSKATKSLARLGKVALESLLLELNQRMDESNVIHIRLDLLDLLSQKITLAVSGGRRTVKGRAKLEVYPGSNPEDVASELIRTSIATADF